MYLTSYACIFQISSFMSCRADFDSYRKQTCLREIRLRTPYKSHSRKQFFILFLRKLPSPGFSLSFSDRCKVMWQVFTKQVLQYCLKLKAPSLSVACEPALSAITWSNNFPWLLVISLWVSHIIVEDFFPQPLKYCFSSLWVFFLCTALLRSHSLRSALLLEIAACWSFWFSVILL